MKSNETDISTALANQANDREPSPAVAGSESERERSSSAILAPANRPTACGLSDVAPGVSDDRAKSADERKRPSGGLLIIGYGNSLRGDDGVGWQIADALARLAGDSATVFTAHQLTPELAEPISGADLVVFVDACYEGQPGTWTCETIRPDPNPSHKFTHYFTPANLLSYTRAVFGVNPKALLVSVAGRSFDYSEGLSPTVATIVPEIVASVSERWNAGASCPDGTIDLANVPPAPGTES
jgi:hydrogenase maturation protease